MYQISIEDLEVLEEEYTKQLSYAQVFNDKILTEDLEDKINKIKKAKHKKTIHEKEVKK